MLIPQTLNFKPAERLTSEKMDDRYHHVVSIVRSPLIGTTNARVHFIGEKKG